MEAMALTSPAATLQTRNAIRHQHPASSAEFGAWRCNSVIPSKRSALRVEAATKARQKPKEKKKVLKSWVRRCEKYMKPFSIDVFASNSHISAKVVHRVTSRTVACATTASRELRGILPSRTSEVACETIGELVAERAKEADVYAVAFTLRDLEGVKKAKAREKIVAVLDAVERNGVVVLYPKEFQAPDKPTLSDCITDYY